MGGKKRMNDSRFRRRTSIGAHVVLDVVSLGVMRGKREEAWRCACMWDGGSVTMTTVFLIYDPHLCPGSGGANEGRVGWGGWGWGGRKQKGGRKQSGDSEVRPVSFYGLLKKKRKRMNILPVLIDFCSSSPALPQGCLFSTLFSSNNGRSHTFAGSISPFLQGKNQQK